MRDRTSVHASVPQLDRLAYQRWVVPDSPPDREKADRINRALRSLSSGDRQILMLRFNDRLSYREIAGELGMAHKGSAHYAVRRALRRLAERYEKRGAER